MSFTESCSDRLSNFNKTRSSFYYLNKCDNPYSLTELNKHPFFKLTIPVLREKLNLDEKTLIVSAKRYHHSGVSGTIVSLKAVPL